MKKRIALLVATAVALALPGAAHAQGPFQYEWQAEQYWAATGYPTCYATGCYYWDGYSWVWYPY